MDQCRRAHWASGPTAAWSPHCLMVRPGRPALFGYPHPGIPAFRRPDKSEATGLTQGLRRAEHGMNASTFTARVVASTGADFAAALRARSVRSRARCTAARRRACCRCSTRSKSRRRRGLGQGRARPRRAPDGLRPPRLSRRGPARPRAAAHGAASSASPRFEAAEALEARRSPSSQARKPDRVLATNVEFWSAVVLDIAEVPPELFTPMFTCARVAGWSAHILEQKREGRLIRPTAKYVGPPPRRREVAGLPSACAGGRA